MQIGIAWAVSLHNMLCGEDFICLSYNSPLQQGMLWLSFPVHDTLKTHGGDIA